VLTRREIEVVALAAEGRANCQIARDLHLSPDSVKGHLARAIVKLGARNRTDAAVTALRLSLIA
jgi:DNA-binding NarL/FixJ family response regulator